MQFKDFNLHPELKQGIAAMGYSRPTPIQIEVIPRVMANKDIIACAQTGTGKTAAYILPLLHNILKSERKHISALILAPTRELALQIDQQLEGFSYFVSVSSIPVYGGNQPEVWENQKAAISRGADVLVATPGRLIAHMKFQYTDLSSINCLILDEADRMLDMGFIDDIKHIVKALPQERQTLMLSATMPEKIRTFAKEILKQPDEINLAPSKPAEGILQAAYLVKDSEKSKLIHTLLYGKEMKSILIFSSTKKDVKRLAESLKSLGFNVEEIHSDLLQSEREDVMIRFKNRNFQILVATDIVSRGIDIEDIDLVINYNVPADPEDYIHRVGRTARAKNTGVAITFISNKEQWQFYKIESFLGNQIYKVPIPEGFSRTKAYDPKNFKKPDKKIHKRVSKKKYRKN